jgi:hypothetical protein
MTEDLPAFMKPTREMWMRGTSAAFAKSREHAVESILKNGDPLLKIDRSTVLRFLSNVL